MQYQYQQYIPLPPAPVRAPAAVSSHTDNTATTVVWMQQVNNRLAGAAVNSSSL